MFVSAGKPLATADIFADVIAALVSSHIFRGFHIQCQSFDKQGGGSDYCPPWPASLPQPW